MAAPEKVDAVIVGAGAAGGVFASVLARAGKHVVLLEQGPDWTLGDLISSDIWSRRLKGSGAPVLYAGKHQVGRTSDTGWGTGGAALHYSANFPRLLPGDFTVKTDHGRALDWPISYADVAPFYDRVAADIGVSGDAKAEERWRPPGAPYPMPPLKTFRYGDVWVPGFATLGIDTIPGAVGINSTAYKGRPACIYDGWCNAGCPTGALANPQATYLGEARRMGAEVRPFSHATRVLTDAAGNRANGVEYYNVGQDGRVLDRQVQEASVVVLAAYASQNPRILFNSRTDRHPDGLANRSGLVGKYLMAHGSATVTGIFAEDVENYRGSNGYHYVSYDRHPKTIRKDAFGSTFWSTTAPFKPNDARGMAAVWPDLYGAELDAFMKVKARGLARITAIIEEMPSLENRVEPAAEKDAFGLPLIRIVHTFGKDTMALWSAAIAEGAAIAKAAGAKEVWPAKAIGPQHLLGGTIMGTNTADSVVNSFGQTHELANLYVAGCGIFPTESAANPTFTLYALSLRGAEQLAGNWASIAT
jgi:choline dehydrogenase-like flavoprotein